MGGLPDDSAVPRWRKSTASEAAGDCVEVASANGHVLLRDSIDESGPWLSLTATQWRALVRRIESGDLSGA